MAIVEKLSILLDFKGEKAIAEMKAAGATAERELGKASGSANQLGNRMMATGAAMVSAGVLVTRTLGKLGDDFVDAGKEVLRLQRMTGGSAEAMSGMRFAAQQSGVSIDALARGYQFLAKNMEANKPAFEKLGVSTRDASGNLRSVNDVMLDVSTRMASMTNIAERNALAQQVFGKSYAELLPLLNKGGDEISRLAAQAAQYGLVLTDQNLGAVKEYIRNQRELGATMQGLKVQIGSGVVGAINSMLGPVKAVASGFQSLSPAARSTIGTLGMFTGTGLIVAGAASTIIGALVRMKSNFDTAREAASGWASGMTRARAAAIGLTTVGIAALLAEYTREMNNAREATEKFLSGQGIFSGTIPEQIDKTKAKIAELETKLQGSGPLQYTAPWRFLNRDELNMLDVLKTKLGDLEGQQASFDNQTSLASRGVDEFGRELDEAGRSTDELRRKQDELWNQLVGQFDASMQVQDTWARVNEALGKYNELSALGKLGTSEGAAAQRDLAQSVEAHARARAEEYVAQVIANGGTVDAATKTAIYRQTLVDLANQYPAVRGQLQATIDLANRTVITQFLIKVGLEGDPLAREILERLAATGGNFGNNKVAQTFYDMYSAAGIIPKFDSGGVVPGRRGAPQLVLAHGGETILPTHRSPAGIGPTRIEVPVVLDGREIARVVTDHQRVDAFAGVG